MILSDNIQTRKLIEIIESNIEKTRNKIATILD